MAPLNILVQLLFPLKKSDIPKCSKISMLKCHNVPTPTEKHLTETFNIKPFEQLPSQHAYEKSTVFKILFGNRISPIYLIAEKRINLPLVSYWLPILTWTYSRLI